MSRPDDNALNDSALELILSQSAELSELPSDLVVPRKLPGLWTSDEITVQNIVDYFNGQNIVQVEREGYQEPQQVVENSISAPVSFYLFN